VSDRRRDLAANRCPVTAPHDDLTSRINDLTSTFNDLTSTFNDLTSTFDDLRSTFNDLTSIPHDLMLASETLNHGSHVGAVGHVVGGKLLGRSSSYIDRHGARNACSSLLKKSRAAE
jgi:hypothetical protein